MANVRKDEEMHRGVEDRLEPVKPIDLSKCKSVDEIVRQMASSSFGARGVGEAADILEQMFKDKDCFRVMTLSGALTIAKMGLVFTEIIDRGWVDAIVSTGALVSHGLIESAGMTHFKHKPSMDDKTLYEIGYDRVYDTLELEVNFQEASKLVDEIFSKHQDGTMLGSWQICEIIGKHLHENVDGKAMLRSAYERKVPVYIPALNDSELGLDLISLRYPSRKRDRKPLTISHDAFADVTNFAERVKDAKKMGIFTIGGGVPRNWAQQIGPFLELKYDITAPSKKYPRYYYGVRICPEPVHWGGLSGCTYSEGVSWGKFDPEGKFAEVYADATLVLPFLVKALMERFDKEK